MVPPRQIISISVLFVGSTFAFGPYHCNLRSLSLSSLLRPPPPPPRWHYDDIQSTSRHRSIITSGGYNTIQSNLCFSIDSQSSMIHAFNDIDTNESTLQLQLQQLALWVFAFASSHIGMSAVRSSIISFFGEMAQALNCVNNKEWVLPSWWPGDDVGGNQIFPDALTAGRQIYRLVYTVVSFVTLGEAFATYLDVSASLQQPAVETVLAAAPLHTACLISAALSYGAVTASLFNASPLGLMPGFNVMAKSNNGEDSSIVKPIANIRRDDTLKFTARGLTRITRHPLILPVVPWGIANAILAGARSCDFILFGGLSIYAIAGCFAQDLRVLRKEGSVGTVFRIDSREGQDGKEEYEEREQLQRFFEATSFIPFQAVFDGRQRLDDIILEIPWLPLVAGTIAGVFIEGWV